jgi:hypothetical protein
MIQKIMIEMEPADDFQPLFSLSVNANLIAKGVTVSQAYYLVGEVLGRIGLPERAETATFDADSDAADGGAGESVSLPEMEAEGLEE